MVRPHEDVLKDANWRYTKMPNTEDISETESGQIPMGMGGIKRPAPPRRWWDADGCTAGMPALHGSTFQLHLEHSLCVG